MDEQAFLDEIAANPADPAPRLIFADWLEERGDLRAELLRLLNELIHIEVPNRAVKEAKMRELLYERNVQPVMPTFTNSIGMKFVQIPPGEFLMGAPDDEECAGPHEKPQHPVTITKPYWLGVYPVTQAEYQTVMGKNPSWCSAMGDGKDQVAGMNTDGFPVEQVSWEDAAEFSRVLSDKQPADGWSYRLPTESEWEFACRAGTTTAFHFGNSLSSIQANFNGGQPYGGAEQGPYLKRPTEVGSYQPNAFGLFELHGNVWEWCADWFGDYSADAMTDPTCPASPDRVFRGGGWPAVGSRCRSARRGGNGPSIWSGSLGFRVVAVQSSGK
ncbi:MAG: SUMF1/EgtB/PvdO family nonheme iron enzyme [Planctomycetales bacterium]